MKPEPTKEWFQYASRRLLMIDLRGTWLHKKIDRLLSRVDRPFLSEEASITEEDRRLEATVHSVIKSGIVG